jgi:AraC-like DNA-binding protein
MKTVFMPDTLWRRVEALHNGSSGMHSQASSPPPLAPAHAPREGSDPLVAVISLLRPRAVLSKVISGAGSWSVRYAAYEDPAFSLVLEGSCFLHVDGEAAIALHEGDFVLLPATPGFRLASDLRLPPTLVTPTHADEVRHGTRAGPATMRLFGGWFRFEDANAQLLVRLLPAMIHVRRGEPGAARLRRLAELVADEVGDHLPGRELILERLVELLLVEALRFRPTTAATRDVGLLAGLGDAALARALRGIHDDVARRWTVGELARAAGMSRAVFAERFARTVGMPPIQYLLEWRMAVAKDLLRREHLPLAQVAERIGYQSASAFSTAFTRHTGCAPSEFSRSTG